MKEQMHTQKENHADSASPSSTKATDLAWEYAQRRRAGERPDPGDYLSQLHDVKSQQDFELLITMDEFTESAIEFQLQDDPIPTSLEQPNSINKR